MPNEWDRTRYMRRQKQMGRSSYGDWDWGKYIFEGIDIGERERERYASVSNWLEEMENIYLNNYSVYGCIVLKLVEYDLMHIVFNIMYSKL